MGRKPGYTREDQGKGAIIQGSSGTRKKYRGSSQVTLELGQEDLRLIKTQIRPKSFFLFTLSPSFFRPACSILVQKPGRYYEGLRKLRDGISASD